MTTRRRTRTTKGARPTGLRTDPEDPTVLLVAWSDGRSVPVPRGIADALRISPDRRLAAKDATRLAEALAVEGARVAALRLLARADRSVARVRQRLLAAGHDEAASDGAVASLRAEGWLDDLRLAATLLDRSSGRKRDRAWVRRAVTTCRRAGLDADTISIAMRRLGVPHDAEDL